jgi:plastocyanin
MAEVVQSEAPPPQPEVVGTTWRKVLVGSAIGQIVMIVIATVFAGLIPPLLLFGVLLIVGAVLTSRGTGKAGPILLLIVSLLHVGLSAPFLIAPLSVPASYGDFITAVGTIVFSITAIIAAVQVLRRREGAQPGARKVWLGGIAVVVLSILVAAVSTFTYEDAEVRESDLDMTTSDFEFSPEELSVSSGEEVSVFIENEDMTLHTFTSEELDVDEVIPAGASIRVTFTAPGPGTYKFECEPHSPDMSGEVVVE